MLIAEDLLLLVTDDASGRLIASSTEVDVALGGAMLVELALMRRVRVSEAGEELRKGRLVLGDTSGTGDVLLDEALAKVARKQGRKPADVVSGLGSKLRPRLMERLSERGLVRQEQGRILGLFPVTRWPAEDAGHESAVRELLRSALLAGMTGDERTACLVSLLHALGVEGKVVDSVSVGLSKRQLKANAKRIAEGDWASAAVRSTIDAMNAAVAVAVTTAATTAATTSG
jgi:hypothetical protein